MNNITKLLQEVDYSPSHYKGYQPNPKSLMFVQFIKEVTGGGEENQTPIAHLRMLDLIFDTSVRQKAIMCARGLGKCLSIDTPVLTPNGYVSMGSIKVGDIVKDMDLNECEVTYTSPIFEDKPMFRFVLEDGYDYEASIDHINICIEPTGKMIAITTEELLSIDFKRYKCVRNYQGILTYYRILDLQYIPYKIASKCIQVNSPTKTYTIKDNIVTHNTTLTAEYGFLYAACFNEYAGVDDLMVAIYIANSIEKGVRTLRRNIEYRYSNSLFLQEMIPNKKIKWTATDTTSKSRMPLSDNDLADIGNAGKNITDVRLEFVNVSGKPFCVNCFGVESGVRGFKEYGRRPELCHRIGTLVKVDGLWTKVEDYHKRSDSRLERGREVCAYIDEMGLTHSEIVTNEHRYMCCLVKCTNKSTPKFEIRWMEAWELKPEQKIGHIYNSYYIVGYQQEDEPNLPYEVGCKVFTMNGYTFKKILYSMPRKELEEFIPIQTPDHTYETLFGISHNCIFDDLIKDTDAKSDALLERIRDTVYSSAPYAMHPTKRMQIWIGTPFNAKDPLYEAVESGIWKSIVLPICEKFPCSEEEFRSVWPDRMTYQYVKEEYDKAVSTGSVNSFYRELMLQIINDEELLVKKDDLDEIDISLFDSKSSAYNYYITTDFAYSDKQSADYSIISVWAYTNNMDFILVDGMCAKTDISTTIETLFRLVSKWKPLQVGIEVTGQQGGYIDWIKREMVSKNIYFNLKEVRPTSDKFSRWNQFVPQYKNHKVKYLSTMKSKPYFTEMEDELFKASKSGFKSKHDDILDTHSQLQYLDLYAPSYEDSEALPDLIIGYDDEEVEIRRNNSNIRSNIIF